MMNLQWLQYQPCHVNKMIRYCYMARRFMQNNCPYRGCLKCVFAQECFISNSINLFEWSAMHVYLPHAVPRVAVSASGGCQGFARTLLICQLPLALHSGCLMSTPLCKYTTYTMELHEMSKLSTYGNRMEAKYILDMDLQSLPCHCMVVAQILPIVFLIMAIA